MEEEKTDKLKESLLSGKTIQVLQILYSVILLSVIYQRRVLGYETFVYLVVFLFILLLVFNLVLKLKKITEVKKTYIKLLSVLVSLFMAFTSRMIIIKVEGNLIEDNQVSIFQE